MHDGMAMATRGHILRIDVIVAVWLYSGALLCALVAMPGKRKSTGGSGDSPSSKSRKRWDDPDSLRVAPPGDDQSAYVTAILQIFDKTTMEPGVQINTILEAARSDVASRVELAKFIDNEVPYAEADMPHYLTPDMLAGDSVAAGMAGWLCCHGRQQWPYRVAQAEELSKPHAGLRLREQPRC